MAVRFRKSFKLAPGVRMNLSGSGFGLSLGPRGASVSIGKRGTFLNTGVPGTGLYARQRIGGGRSRATRNAPAPLTSLSVTVGVRDDGSVYFQDPDGIPLPERLEAQAKRQHRDVIRELLQQKCDEINSQIEAVGELHLDTPDHRERPSYSRREFTVPSPARPAPRVPKFPGRLFKRIRDRIEDENARATQQYEKALASWRSEREHFVQAEAKRADLIEHAIYSDPSAMETFLEEQLQEIAWPRETVVSASVLDSGRLVFVDVDLPEVEDMPCKTAAVAAQANKLSVKAMSPAQVQRLYMRHVHGIGFRIIGEVFAALPKVEEVVLSGFSQRPDRATGQVADQYLYSVRVSRGAWSTINFGNLEELDVVDALSRFELRRAMTKAGSFKPIDPFAPREPAES